MRRQTLRRASEAWLRRNKRAARLVKQGLKDAKQKRLVNAKEDFSRYARGDE